MTHPWGFHAKLTPSADADTYGVPSQAGLVGRFAEPEVPMVEEFDFVFLVENGFVFAAMHAVITSDADVVVTVKGLLHVVKLLIQHLLRSEDFGGHEIHLVADDLTTLVPLFALHAIVPVLVTDIVGTDQHILGRKLQ